MTITAAGSNPAASLHNVITSPLTTNNVGNLIVLIVTCHTDGTNYCTGISDSASRVTWTQLTAPHNGSNANIPAGPAWTALIWTGVVTSVGATTVTFTYSGGAPAFTNAAGMEFTVTSGALAVDAITYLDGNGVSAWPSLTPAGNGELYLGFAWNFSTATSGSTSGYVYNANADAAGNGMAYNPNCPAGVATAPVWGDSSETWGLMVLLAESAPVVSGPQVLPYAGGQVRQRQRQLRRQSVFPGGATSITTAIAYATSQDIVAGGAGSWVNPGNADGAPDGTYATWTAP